MYKEILISSKSHIISLVLIVLVMMVLLVLSHVYLNGKKELKQQAYNSLHKEVAKYKLAKINTELLKKYKSKYTSLKQKGLLEGDDRLSWVNVMEDVVNKNLITSVQYKISKQIKYKEPGLSRAYPDIDIYKSDMVIEMELLHEGDLYAFFNELKANAKGLFEIKKCTISAPASILEAILESLSDSNLKARCDVNWYSLKKIGA